MQVTATQESAASTPRFPRNEEARTKFDNFVVAMEELSSGHIIYMEKLWQLMQVCTNQNAVLDVMNNVSIPPIQVTVNIQKPNGSRGREDPPRINHDTPHSRPTGATTELLGKHVSIGGSSKFCSSETDCRATHDSSHLRRVLWL